MALFLLALVPRAHAPVSRPIVWSDRGFHFANAVLRRDWADTYRRYHPGVTTMWLSGFALRWFAHANGDLSADQMLGIAPVKPGTLDDAVLAGVLPLAVAISAAIALTYPLLQRRAGTKVALAGTVLLALDPFHLSNSKVIHPDAMLASLMLLSVLFFWNWLSFGKRRNLVASGLVAGLAFLTKSPSLFLVPFLGLSGVAATVVGENVAGEERAPWQAIALLLRGMLLWGAVAGITFVIFWPAMWVEPLAVLQRMAQRVLFHVEEEHSNPVYFMGVSALRDPGPLFYVATVGFKTTLVTLPLALLGVVSGFVGRLGRRQLDVILLSVYVLAFGAQMSLGAWKQMPYILPVFPAIALLAAYGIGWLTELVAKAGRAIHVGVVVIPLVAQALIVLPRHPYYGTHHNLLLGGSQVAQRVLPLQDQGEGLDLAADVLNQMPYPERATAWVHLRSGMVFQRGFAGYTSWDPEPWINYRVYYVNQVMRRLDYEEWGEAWECDQRTEPLLTISFDGVPYVWVYGEPPEEPAAGGPERLVRAKLGEHITLERIRVNADALRSGEMLVVVPVWSSDGAVPESYTVFCHLLSPEGDLVAQADGLPLVGHRPTTTWRAGEELVDSYQIVLPEDLPSGSYQLSVGMYLRETMTRLPAMSASGEELPDGRVVYGTIEALP
ncbi:MAG: glycosyltransferase family 39 protein [Anaerolineae bacterium]